MTTSDTFAERFRRGRAQMGPLRSALLLVTALTFIVGGLMLLLIDEERGTIQLFLAFINVCLGLWWFLDRPKPNWSGVFLHAAAAAVFLGYYFHLIRYPLIQGVF